MRELRRAAWERQRGLCAVTGLALGDPDGGWALHHRLAGGMGGTARNRDRLSNLVGVLPGAHNLGARSIHGAPAWSRPLGLLLSQSRGDDPAAVPVLMAGVGWVWLDDGGGWVPVA